MLLGVNYYDEEERITKVYKQHYQSSSVKVGTYDEVANAYNFEELLTASTRYTGNSLNGITGDFATGAYSYDGNGNVTTDGRNGVTLGYNYLNFLKHLPNQV